MTAIAAAGVVAIRAALGLRATGARLQRMQKSPEWQRSHFENSVHWGLFTLASHGWTEPIVISPRPGQSVEPTAERPQEHWWPALPWRTAAQNPIVAHHGD